ncbi:hypothetical protein [Membranihabitans maritimus]|uniref:hypothetical protein n=1 Tax=Membranihabitans maritimus TaxID=2904244 RepID=UPI001F1B2CDE|nr:hypothetical protein [Membranihabitans maritimus]
MKRNSLVLFVLAIAMSFTIVSCNSGQEEKMKQQFEAEKTELQNKLEKAGDEISAEMDQVEDKLDNLQSQMANNAENASDEVKEEWNKMKTDLNNQLAKLEDKKENLDAELNRLGQATKENWAEFKKDVNETFNF